MYSVKSFSKFFVQEQRDSLWVLFQMAFLQSGELKINAKIFLFRVSTCEFQYSWRVIKIWKCFSSDCSRNVFTKMLRQFGDENFLDQTN